MSSVLKKVRMTLTGGLEGKTIVLNKRRFISGVFETEMHEQYVEKLRRYFTRSYQVKFEIDPDDAAPVEETKEDVVVEEESLPEPDERQVAILMALNQITPDKWEGPEQGLLVSRPPIVMVADLANDPHLTEDELLLVVETWYGKWSPASSEAPAEEEPQAEDEQIDEVQADEAPAEEEPQAEVQDDQPNE